ncbi:MAG: hypothetical protein ACRDQZ_09945, partial [Mycobacteriales bacterium]
MIPLEITAELRGPITGAPNLDGLLASVVAQELGLVAEISAWQDIDIPLEKEPGGRFHLASSAIATWDQHETRFVNQKFPLAEAQSVGDSRVKRIKITEGRCKSYRIPGAVAHAEGDGITWYAMGDPAKIEALLSCVTHLGKKRGVGRGAVAAWRVVRCVPWGKS